MAELENVNRSGVDAGSVNNPDIDPKTLKVQLRALKDGKQAASLGEALEQASETRNKTNAVIVAKYDGEQPFSPSALEAAGEDWRNNFPTNFMAGIIDRIVPVPMSTIDGARYLTNSKLDHKKFPDNPSEKSEKFCTIITRKVRQWRGWRPLCYSLCQEDILIGYAIVASPDKYNWRPKLFRSDEGFVPNGTGQHSDHAQALGLNHDFMIHELTEIIADRENAHDAGWDIEAAVKSLNRAMPKAENDTNKPRSYEDCIREGNRGNSYGNAAKVVRARHVIVVEPTTTKAEDGKFHQLVSHYIVDRDTKDVLFEQLDEFEMMSDCLTLFTLQPGNGKFYGSKGLGKILVNIHIAIDRARNIAFDQLHMAGLKILKTDGKANPTIQLKVRHPFAIVSSDAEFAEQHIASNADEFIELDNKLTSIAEQAANAYIPNKVSDDTPGNRTATEAAIDNARDQQAKVAYLARFWGQFGEMMTTIQKKLCDPDTIDEDAKDVQAQLHEAGLSPEEIKALAYAPATEVVQDMAAAENQQILAASQALEGNEHIDQGKLLRLKVTAMTSPAIADDLILPDAVDQNVEGEAIRQQLIENEMFMLGTSINVVPRDNHSVHLKVLKGELERAAPMIEKNVTKTPAILDHINAAIVHGMAHVDELAKLTKEETDEIKAYAQFFKMANAELVKLAGKIKAAPQDSPVLAGGAAGDTSSPGSPSGPATGLAATPVDPAAAAQVPALMNAMAALIKAGVPITHEDINAVLARAGLPPLENTPAPNNPLEMAPPASMLTPGAQPPTVPPIALPPQLPPVDAGAPPPVPTDAQPIAPPPVPGPGIPPSVGIPPTLQ